MIQRTRPVRRREWLPCPGNDKDSILDSADNCPNEPEDKDSLKTRMAALIQTTTRMGFSMETINASTRRVSKNTKGVHLQIATKTVSSIQKMHAQIYQDRQSSRAVPTPMGMVSSIRRTRVRKSLRPSTESRMMMVAQTQLRSRSTKKRS